ncbi:MAK10-like protein [Tanacetum coccineum]
MGDENPIRTLRDYSKPSHEGYRNTIELPVGNNVVPLRSDTIRLVQNGCSFHRLWSEDPSQHLKDFLKCVDSLDLDGENRERTRMRLFQFSLRDQASNRLERLPARSITTWEDLTTRFLAQFFPPGRTAKLRNDILMFQQHHGESLSEAYTRFKDLLQKVPHHGIDLWLQDLALYDNESWNGPRDFSKPVKAIALPQDVPSTSDRRLIKLENQVQRLMEAHLTLTQPTQVNKVTTSCEICSVLTTLSIAWKISNKPLLNTHPRMSIKREVSEGLVSNFMASQDARLTKFEADFKQQQSKMTNKIDTVLKAITDRIAGALPSDMVKNPKLSTSLVLSARFYPNMNPRCSNHIQGSINAVTIHSEKQSDFYDEKAKENEEEENDSPENIHVNPSTPSDLSVAFITEKVLKLNSFFESLGLVPQSSDTKVVSTKGDDGEVMFIELIKKNDDSSKGESKEEGSTTTKRIMRRKLDPRENSNRGVSNFTGRIKEMHVFVENFTYIVDFMIVEDISSIINPRLSQVVPGKPFVEISNMAHDPPEGVVRFTNGADEVTYKMPHMIEQYNSLSNLEKEHTKSVYLRNE